MKKIYQKPTTTEVNVKIETLLNGGSATQNVIVSDNPYSGEAPVESRRGSLWDEEE